MNDAVSDVVRRLVCTHQFEIAIRKKRQPNRHRGAGKGAGAEAKEALSTYGYERQVRTANRPVGF